MTGTATLLLACALTCAAPVIGAEHDAMTQHMDDDPLRFFVLADRLEWQSDGAEDRAAWALTGWIGKDENRLWVRADGERGEGATEESDVEALWGRPLSRWWDLLAGVRHDFAPGGSRNWAALGVTGLAPYEFDVELTAYVGERGTVALSADIEYELLLTQRWVLQPRVEAMWFSRDDGRHRAESGLSKSALGLRLRYEIRREFAPYLGVEWSRSGDTRDTLAFVAGVRAWL